MIKFSDINECRQYVCEDFKRFVEYAASLEGHQPPQFHYHIADWLQSGMPVKKWWRSKKKVVLGFRLAAKTWLLRQYVLWRWLRCPWMQVIMHSSTDDMAKRMAKATLKALRDNPLLTHLAPEGQTGSYEFNLNGIEPEQGMSLICAGIKTSLTSSRADLYCFDDPEPDVEPESMHDRIINAMMEAMHILHRPTRHIDKFAGVAELPAAEYTQLVVVGQPHCQSSVYVPESSDFDEEIEGAGHPLRDAQFVKIPVIDKTGDWMWPEMMEAKYYNHEEERPKTVEEVRGEFTSENWFCQMMIEPGYAEGQGAILNMNEIEKRTRLVPDGVMAVDPADSAENGCEWGIAIGDTYHGENGHKIHVAWMGGFVGEAYEGDEDTIGESVWRQIFDMAFEFGVKTVLLEVNLKAAQTACRRYCRKAGISMRVEEVRAKFNKLRRIGSALEQPINNGMVSASPDVLADSRNRRQLTRLAHNKLPNPCDRIDALAMLFDYLNERGPELSNPLSLSDFPPAAIPLKAHSRLGMEGRNLLGI